MANNLPPLSDGSPFPDPPPGATQADIDAQRAKQEAALDQEYLQHAKETNAPFTPTYQTEINGVQQQVQGSKTYSPVGVHPNTTAGAINTGIESSAIGQLATPALNAAVDWINQKTGGGARTAAENIARPLTDAAVPIYDVVAGGYNRLGPNQLPTASPQEVRRNLGVPEQPSDAPWYQRGGEGFVRDAATTFAATGNPYAALAGGVSGAAGDIAGPVVGQKFGPGAETATRIAASLALPTTTRILRSFGTPGGWAPYIASNTIRGAGIAAPLASIYEGGGDLTKSLYGAVTPIVTESAVRYGRDLAASAPVQALRAGLRSIPNAPWLPSVIAAGSDYLRNRAYPPNPQDQTYNPLAAGGGS